MHVDSSSEKAFRRCRFQIDHLDAWATGPKSSFDTKINEHNGKTYGTTKYIPPKDFVTQLDEKTTLKIESNFKHSETFHPKQSVAFERNTLAEISCSQPLGWDELYSLAIKFKHLTELLAGHSSQINSMWLGTDSKDKSKGALLFCNDIKPNSAANEKHVHDMLIPLNAIRRRLRSVAHNWFTNYDRYSNPLGVHFSELRRPAEFVEQKFLNQIRVIEGIHRQLYFKKDFVLPTDRHKRLIAKIMGNLTTEEAQWARSKLQLSNQMSLRQRLLQIAERNQELIDLSAGDFRLFSKYVANARNDEAHQFPKDTLPQKIKFRHDGAAWKLRVLADMTLFNLIGLPGNLCLSQMKRNHRYWYYASKDSFPWRES